MSDFLPRLTKARNEVVAWAGLVTAILSGVVVAVSELDLTSPHGLALSVGPALSALVGRRNAYGPATYANGVEAARRSGGV